MPAHRTWTDKQLIAVVRDARSMGRVLSLLGLRGHTSYAHLRGHIDRLGLDTSHFSGQSWARGNRKPSHEIRATLLPQLRKGNRVYNLRARLIGSGLKESRCEDCGISEWQGKPAPLQVDHVDGDRLNNELANLKILCANCHMLTETWGFKNARRRPDQALVA